MIHLHQSLDPRLLPSPLPVAGEPNGSGPGAGLESASRPVLSRPQLLLKLSGSAVHAWVQSECRTGGQGALETVSSSLVEQFEPTFVQRNHRKDGRKVETLKVKPDGH